MLLRTSSLRILRFLKKNSSRNSSKNRNFQKLIRRSVKKISRIYWPKATPKLKIMNLKKSGLKKCIKDLLTKSCGFCKKILLRTFLSKIVDFFKYIYLAIPNQEVRIFKSIFLALLAILKTILAHCSGAIWYLFIPKFLGGF